MADPLDRAEPWTSGHTRAVVAGYVLAAAALTSAWRGASGATHVRDQIVWATIGAVAVGAVVGAELWWLFIGRSTIGQAQRLLLVEIGREDAAAQPLAANDRLAPVVAGSTMTHYHRPTCLLVRGKVVRQVSAARTELRPCDVCGPEALPR
jgi:hypothetical protein